MQVIGTAVQTSLTFQPLRWDTKSFPSPPRDVISFNEHLSGGLLPGGHAQNISPIWCPGGSLTRCPNHLNWLSYPHQNKWTSSTPLVVFSPTYPRIILEGVKSFSSVPQPGRHSHCSSLNHRSSLPIQGHHPRPPLQKRVNHDIPTTSRISSTPGATKQLFNYISDKL